MCVIKYSDLTPKEREFIEAKPKELSRLKSRNTWYKVKVSDVPTSGNILGGRFKLNVKNVGNPDKMVKVQHVAQRYEDKPRPFSAHVVCVLRPTFVKEFSAFQ